MSQIKPLAIYYYISSAPLFWASMGMVVATAMFIGAMVYNGDLKKITKVLLSVLVYAFFLTAVTTNRLYFAFISGNFDDPVLAFAGVMTTVIVTLFYILGMFFGVLLVKWIKNGKI